MALMFFQSLTSPPAAGGTNISYYATVPENSVGENGDIAIVTSTRSHYEKIADIWTLKMGSVEIPNGIAIYADKTTLLAAAGSSANQLAIVNTEPGNMYLRNSENTKWVVLSANKYETVDLPSDTDFIIPSGTVIWDITESKHLYN